MNYHGSFCKVKLIAQDFLDFRNAFLKVRQIRNNLAPADLRMKHNIIHNFLAASTLASNYLDVYLFDLPLDKIFLHIILNYLFLFVNYVEAVRFKDHFEVFGIFTKFLDFGFLTIGLLLCFFLRKGRFAAIVLQWLLVDYYGDGYIYQRLRLLR